MARRKSKCDDLRLLVLCWVFFCLIGLCECTLMSLARNLVMRGARLKGRICTVRFLVTVNVYTLWDHFIFSCPYLSCEKKILFTSLREYLHFLASQCRLEIESRDASAIPGHLQDPIRGSH